MHKYKCECGKDNDITMKIFTKRFFYFQVIFLLFLIGLTIYTINYQVPEYVILKECKTIFEANNLCSVCFPILNR